MWDKALGLRATRRGPSDLCADHQGISDCTEASFRFFETGERPDEHMLENPDWWELQKQRQEKERLQQDEPSR